MDEVITGFGRTGKYFASEHWAAEPDILIFGKGVSSGYGPLSGVMATSAIYDAMRKKKAAFSTGHTFSGNPLGAAGALGVLAYIEKHGVVKRAAENGAYLQTKLLELMERCPFIDDVRGKGLLWGVEFALDKVTKACFDPAAGITAKVVEACFRNGLIVYPSSGFLDGLRGDSILISPPLIIEREEIDLLAELLEKSVREVF
ncbi:MAG: aminotransferase class III-fold pyridoxal phosphate-dependent enzyme, partial [Bacillota bacterium]|nr:aminotransferase class III-fold pyridoxal phosphate-dependent enzyme [Bacillota bacterium]